MRVSCARPGNAGITTNLQLVLNTQKYPYLYQATPKNSCQILPPKKILETKIHPPPPQKKKNPSIIPVTYNPEYLPWVKSASLLSLLRIQYKITFLVVADQLVWRAARGTGAAPSFFRAMGQFLDGGLIANNPTLDVLTDIHKYNSTVRGDQACPFGLVVSLGTGVPPPMRVTSFDVFKPESIWDATNVLMGARALGELLVDQVCTSTPYLRHPPSLHAL